MNIKDVEVPDKAFPTTQALWEDIFEQQAVLMKKYDEIETANGFVVPNFLNINSRFLQHRIKDFFWRATEEMSEALEALDHLVMVDHLHLWRENWDNVPSVQHFFEELADTLHFMVEVSIMSRYLAAEVDETWVCSQVRGYKNKPTAGCVEITAIKFIKSLGLSANCLKNKPWKQTEVETDISRFNGHFRDAWYYYFSILDQLGLKDYEVYNLYTKKNNVNQFRQRSRY